MWQHWLAVGLGGALGAMARSAVALYLPVAPIKLPLATLLVNVLGSFLMGCAYAIIVEKAAVAAEFRQLIMVGFLGAFTTFSTFSLDALMIWQNQGIGWSVGYVVASVIASIAAAMIGIKLVLWLFF